MCLGPELVAALSIASTAASFVGQQAQASSQASYQAQVENNAAIERAQTQQAITNRQAQESIAANRNKMANQKEAAGKRSEIMVSAAAANISGNSVFNLIRDVYRQEGQNADTISFNNEMTIQQLQAEKDSANSTYSARTAFAPIQRPSIFGAGLEIAGAGLQLGKDKGWISKK